MAGLFFAIGLGSTELIIILVIVVVIFGAGKLTDVGKQLGQGIREFKNEVGGGSDDSSNRQITEDSTREMQDVPRDVTDEHRNRS